MNQKLLGDRRDHRHPRHRLRAVDEPQGDPARASSARPSRCRRSSPCSCSRRAGAAPAIQTLVGGRRQPARLCEQGHRVPVRPERQANPLAHTFAIAALAGDHLLREPRRDPLLSRDHAADRPLGRRRDRLGDRHQPRRIAVARPRTSSSASPKSPLVVRPYLAALPPSRLFTVMCVGMAGVAGTILAAYASLLGAQLSALSARRGLHVRAGRHPDGQDDHARRSGRLPTQGARTPRSTSPRRSRRASSPPTSSWPPRRARRPASSWRWRSARWCWRSSRWSRSPTGCSAGSATWSAFRTSASSGSSATSSRRSCILIGVPWNEAGTAGGLFGTKLVLNEFVAFIDLGKMDAATLSERSRAIVTFALCGFANFSSIAIQMAVTGGLAPNQRPVIARLGIRAFSRAASPI